MSRAASVTLEFVADMSAAEQRYEAFVRKVSRPIPLNFSGGPGGAAPGNAQSATFGTPGTPYTGGGAVDSGYREAFQRRADSERMVATANERLAFAVSRQAAATDQTATNQRTIDAQRTSNWMSPASAAAGVYRDSPGRAADVEQSPSGQGLITADELSGLAGGRQARRSSSRLTRGLSRYLAAGFLLREGLSVAADYRKEGIEERLAVSEGGQTDLHRQLRAQQEFISKVENVPIVGQLAGLAADSIASTYGSGAEDTGRILQQAESGEARVKAVRSQGDYRESFVRRNRVESQSGQFAQAVVEADVNRLQQEKEALRLRNETVALNQKQGQYGTEGPDKSYHATIDEIRKGYNLTMDKIAKSYGPVFEKIKDEIPVLAARAQGNNRTADRLQLQADIKQEVTAATLKSDDLGRLAAREGRARLAAFDAQRDRDDTADLAESGFRREAFQRKSVGDDAGELFASQQARRTQRLRNIGHDDPRRKAYEDELTAQEGSENADFERARNLRIGSLQGDVAISGLQALGKPHAAEVESIYRKAELSAQKDFGRPDEASLELQVGYNNLAAYKKRLTQGGHGEEVSPGSLGVGGTQGSEPDDANETMKAIDEKMASLLAEMQKLNGVMAGSD